MVIFITLYKTDIEKNLDLFGVILKFTEMQTKMVKTFQIPGRIM
jgi:hypothetical protein